MIVSPIVLFVCNRPAHTLKVLSALKKNKLSKKSLLIIYLDKPIKKMDMMLYLKVVKIIKNTSGFKNKKIILRKKNFGLAKNFISLSIFSLIKKV